MILEAYTAPLNPPADLLRLDVGTLDVGRLAGPSDVAEHWRDLTPTAHQIDYTIGADPDPLEPFPDLGTLTVVFRDPPPWPDLLPGQLIRLRHSDGTIPHTWRVVDWADAPSADGSMIRTLVASDGVAILQATEATAMSSRLTVLSALARIEALTGTQVNYAPWETMLTDDPISYADGLTCADYLDRLCLMIDAIWYLLPAGQIDFMVPAQRVADLHTLSDEAAHVGLPSAYLAVELEAATAAVVNRLTFNLADGTTTTTTTWTNTASAARYGVRARTLEGIAGGTPLGAGVNYLGESWPAMTDDEAQPYRWLQTVADASRPATRVANVTTGHRTDLTIGIPLGVRRAGTTHHGRIVGQRVTLTPLRRAPFWSGRMTHYLIPRTPSS